MTAIPLLALMIEQIKCSLASSVSRGPTKREGYLANMITRKQSHTQNHKCPLPYSVSTAVPHGDGAAMQGPFLVQDICG